MRVPRQRYEGNRRAVLVFNVLERIHEIVPGGDTAISRRSKTAGIERDNFDPEGSQRAEILGLRPLRGRKNLRVHPVVSSSLRPPANCCVPSGDEDGAIAYREIIPFPAFNGCCT
jgi:hypothetical protein